MNLDIEPVKSLERVGVVINVGPIDYGLHRQSAIWALEYDNINPDRIKTKELILHLMSIFPMAKIVDAPFEDVSPYLFELCLEHAELVMEWTHIQYSPNNFMFDVTMHEDVGHPFVIYHLHRGVREGKLSEPTLKAFCDFLKTRPPCELLTLLMQHALDR